MPTRVKVCIRPNRHAVDFVHAPPCLPASSDAQVLKVQPARVSSAATGDFRGRVHLDPDASPSTVAVPLVQDDHKHPGRDTA